MQVKRIIFIIASSNTLLICLLLRIFLNVVFYLSSIYFDELRLFVPSLSLVTLQSSVLIIIIFKAASPVRIENRDSLDFRGGAIDRLEAPDHMR